MIQTSIYLQFALPMHATKSVHKHDISLKQVDNNQAPMATTAKIRIIQYKKLNFANRKELKI